MPGVVRPQDVFVLPSFSAKTRWRSTFRLKCDPAATCAVKPGLSSALPAGMTLVTIDAVVDVALHALVIWIGLSRRVAIRALEYRVVIRIGVARGADVVRVAVTGGELRVLRVIECGARPGSRVVAVLACGGEE